jgi:imidazolonepropionase-like amidohydrolase
MPVISNPKQASMSVAWQKQQGYDFVKVYDHLNDQTYQAILSTAQEYELPVVGHAPQQVGLDSVLASGQLTIEHLTGYIDPDTAEFIIPENQLDTYARLSLEAGVWNCPTIGVYQKHVPNESLGKLENQPEMAYISPKMKILWKYMFRPGAMQNISYEGDYPAQIARIYSHMTKVLRDNGAGIIAGTDANNPYVVPGSSLLEELDNLVDAGLSPYETIETATRNAAQALGRLDEFGTITEGKRADLLLVRGNPLQDVSYAQQRTGVMVRGQWLPEQQLQEMLAELAVSHSPTWLERVWPLLFIALGIFLIVRQAR